MWSDSFKLSCTEKTQKSVVAKQVVPTFRWEAHHGFADSKSAFGYQKAHTFPYHSLDPYLASSDLGGRNRTTRWQGPDQRDGDGHQWGCHSGRTNRRQE